MRLESTLSGNSATASHSEIGATSNASGTASNSVRAANIRAAPMSQTMLSLLEQSAYDMNNLSDFLSHGYDSSHESSAGNDPESVASTVTINSTSNSSRRGNVGTSKKSVSRSQMKPSMSTQQKLQNWNRIANASTQAQTQSLRREQELNGKSPEESNPPPTRS